MNEERNEIRWWELLLMILVPILLAILYVHYFPII